MLVEKQGFAVGRRCCVSARARCCETPIGALQKSLGRSVDAGETARLFQRRNPAARSITQTGRIRAPCFIKADGARQMPDTLTTPSARIRLDKTSIKTKGCDNVSPPTSRRVGDKARCRRINSPETDAYCANQETLCLEEICQEGGFSCRPLAGWQL